MANPEHLAKLKEGVKAWNQWRNENPDVAVDLSEADLTDAELDGANLRGVDLFNANLNEADLRGADLRGAKLREATLGGADLREAKLCGADLCSAYLRVADLSEANLGIEDFHEAGLDDAKMSRARFNRADLDDLQRIGVYLAQPDVLGGADLTGANLTGAVLNGAKLVGAHLREANLDAARLVGAYLARADLSRAVLSGTNLSGADLTGADLHEVDLDDANLSGAKLNRADLSGASLLRTGFERANLTGCNVYGVSVWDIRLEGAIQSNLVITPPDQSAIQVDNLEVAQFVYLLLNNERIRHVIDTITSKVVLILGRFTDERKVVLDAIRDELRKRDYLPVLFDFQKPDSKDLTATVTTLANMARFIIADLTDPSSVPHELAMVVPGTVVPVQTLLLNGQREYAMFADLKRRYHWVLEPYQYESEQSLMEHLVDGVIAPAEAKVEELRDRQ